MKRNLTIYSPEGDLWAELIYADGKISILRANPIYKRGLQFALERDYDKTIITEQGIERLYAKKNSPEFLDVLTRFHEYNYGCKVTSIDISEFAFKAIIIYNQQPQIEAEWDIYPITLMEQHKQLEQVAQAIDLRQGTIELWIPLGTVLKKSERHSIIEKKSDDGELKLFIDENKNLFFVHHISPTGYRTVHHDISKLSGQEMHQIVATWQEEEINLYLNGKLVATSKAKS